MDISNNFDSGSIEIISCNNIKNIQLKIRKDNAAEFRQWFYFGLHGVKNKEFIIFINELDKTTYPQAWDNYNIVVSYDRINWFRIKTIFEKNKLIIKFKSLFDSIYFAYFEPYTYENHLNLISKFQLNKYITLQVLGKTKEKRNIDLLKIKNDYKKEKKFNIWIIARQHPGESMAQWFVEGFIERILDNLDQLSILILNKANFYIIPNMNPDGTFHGNLRTNSQGINLNREWLNPSIEKSPEVLYVKNKIYETGIDMFFDIHGDEVIPYNFLAGNEGIPNYSKKIAKLENYFKKYLKDICPNFQTKYGYPKDKPYQANLSMASSFIGNEFKCLSFTLEMPFKDNNDYPDSTYGWNGYKSKLLGKDFIYPIQKLLNILR